MTPGPIAKYRSLLLLLLAAPLMGAFAWQDVLATFGDDSASYLTLARYFADPASSPQVAQWAGYHSNFPPLFPLVLAATGGAHDLRIAYLVVAACAAVALALFHRFAVLQLGECAGLVVSLLFLLTPTAWITLKGILSEPLYLLMCMASLLYYEARLQRRDAGAHEWLLFGVLLAGACLTRTAGIALLAAYAARTSIRLWARAERPSCSLVLPALPVVVLAGLWYTLRPQADVDNYRRLATSVAGWWLEDPAAMLEAAADLLFAGWIRSFMADHYVSFAAKVVFGVVGLVALAGVLIRLARNRLDAWFVVFSLGITFIWTFSPDAARRLLYPVVPLLVFYAAEGAMALCTRLKIPERRRAHVIAAFAALPVLLCVPALATVAKKSQDRRPVIAGCAHAYRDVSDYYSILNQGSAEQVSRIQVTVLCGLSSLQQLTPPGATVMWVRPEYVALLGNRNAVAQYFRWTPRELAAEIRRSNVDYLIVSTLYKNDLEGGKGKPIEGMREDAYSQLMFVLNSDHFLVRKVDRAALARFLD